MTDPLTQLRDWLEIEATQSALRASKRSGQAAVIALSQSYAFKEVVEKLDSLTSDADIHLRKRLASHHLTPMQMKVAVAIAKYWRENNIGPTMQELADELGVSKVTIFEHAGALERKGAVVRKGHTSRALAVVGGAA